jgi:uncharacterized protein YdaU (DUF1376 family)
VKIASFSIADYCEATEGMPHDVERLYFRMIMKMLSREAGLPDDDNENARMFGYTDVRTFKRLKAKLLKWPKAIFADDGLLKNERVEEDLIIYRDRRAQAARSGQIGGRSRRDRTEIAGRSAEDRPEIDPRSSEYLDSDPAKINDLAEASPSPSPTPSPIETPESPFSSEARGEKDDHERVRFSNGKIELFNGMRAYWLERFEGDSERLELGLIQAAGFVQTNSAKPLEAQVSAQLARQCADKRDRDKRYAETARRNADSRQRAVPLMSPRAAEAMRLHDQLFGQRSA